MKTEIKEGVRLSKIVIKAVFFMLIPITIFVIGKGLSPAFKINELKETVLSDSVYMKTYDHINDLHELQSLNRKLAYNEALMKVSGNDSIILIVNLRDSIIALSIKGVIIHRTILKNFKTEPLITKLPNWVYNYLFSKPLSVTIENTTIVKEPIVVREAPKNAEEAALNAYEPDTLIQNPAFLRMKLNHNINLVFEQEENATKEDKRARSSFRKDFFYKKTGESIYAFFTFSKQQYDPIITMEIPANDIREIYRALPEKAKVVLSF